MDDSTLRTGTVYGFKLKVPGARTLYVGQTKNSPHMRLKGHYYHAVKTGAKAPISAWVREHGVDAIEVVFLETDVPVDKLVEREEHWTLELKTLVEEGGLNTRRGYAWHGGRPDAVEYAKRMNEVLAADPELSARAHAKHREAMRKLYAENPELGQRISDRNRKRYEDPAARALTSETTRLAHQRPEVRVNMSRAQKQSANTEEGKIRMSEIGKVGGPKGGRISGHNRWHRDRGIVKAGCPLCAS